ncbi:MAG: tetratricopeptide repeat protein [Candidatus Sericytochromatia bacterium]
MLHDRNRAPTEGIAVSGENQGNWPAWRNLRAAGPDNRFMERKSPNLREALLLMLQRPILFWLAPSPRNLPLQLEVMDLLVKYQALPPQNMTELLYLRAEGYLKMEKPQQALVALDDLLSHPVARLSRYQAWAHLHRGHLHQKLRGDLPAAVADLQAARSQMSEANTTSIQRYTICLDLAWCLVRLGEYAEAIETLSLLLAQGIPTEIQQTLGKRPESLYALRAYANYQLRDYRAAMLDLDRSEGVPGSFMPGLDDMDTAHMLYTFAGIRAQAEDIQGAFTDLAMAIRLLPDLRVQARSDELFAPLRDLPEVQAFLAEQTSPD